MAFLRKIFVFVACVVSLNGFAHTIAIPDGDKKAKVLIHDNGYEMYEHLLAAISSAKYTVELCPCLAGGEILSTSALGAAYGRSACACKLHIGPTYMY